MKIDTDGDNVVHTTMTVDAARGLIDIDDLPVTLMEAVDEAQAHVFGGVHPRAYLVIEITK